MYLFHRKLRSFEEIYELSTYLSHFFREPEDVQTGIHELLVNAMEYGYLGMDASRKHVLCRSGVWHEETARRLERERRRNRCVDVTFTREGDTCRLTIADPGTGFDWQAYMHDGLRNDRFHGRGLKIVRNAGFDDVMFNKTGNKVTCVADSALP